MEPKQPASTITVTYRNRTRFARIRLTHPGGRRMWLIRLTNRCPGRIDLPDYDAELAMKLISGTSELPDSRHDLIVMLTHYRHALLSVATKALASQAARTP